MTVSSSWQDALAPPFLQRLLRPWLHPGLIDPGLARTLFDRYQPMTPLPLVDRLRQRQNRTTALHASASPIAYAQPAPPPTPVTGPVASLPITAGRAEPITSQPTAQPIVIQAKFISSSQSVTPASVGQPSTGRSTPPPVKPLPTVQARAESTSPAFGLPPTHPSDWPQPAPSPGERSSLSPVPDPFHPVAPDRPELPLVSPAHPAPPAVSSALLRPRRPRFERDLVRPVAPGDGVLRTDADDPTVSVSPPATMLPLMTPSAADPSQNSSPDRTRSESISPVFGLPPTRPSDGLHSSPNPGEHVPPAPDPPLIQAAHSAPTSVSQSLLSPRFATTPLTLQNPSSNRDMPLVLVGLPQPRKKSDRPKLPMLTRFSTGTATPTIRQPQRQPSTGRSTPPPVKPLPAVQARAESTSPAFGLPPNRPSDWPQPALSPGERPSLSPVPDPFHPIVPDLLELPLVATPAADPSLPLVTQPLSPIAVTPPSTLSQNPSLQQDMPLVPAGLLQPKEKSDRLELPVVIHSATRRASPTTGQQQQQSSLLPLVQVFHLVGIPGQPVTPEPPQPLVFFTPAVRTMGAGSANGSLADTGNPISSRPADRDSPGADLGRSGGMVPTLSQSIPGGRTQPQFQVSQQPTLDLDALTDKVERKLIRRFVVERERRGWNS